MTIMGNQMGKDDATGATRSRRVTPRRAWLQDTTRYVPPTTSVSEVPLKADWAKVSSSNLSHALGVSLS